MNTIVGEAYGNSLKNKFFGLLCEYEKGGEWEKYLDTLAVEILGVPEDKRSINWVHLFNKVSALRYLSYPYFRKTIFDCMSLISQVNWGE